MLVCNSIFFWWVSGRTWFTFDLIYVFVYIHSYIYTSNNFTVLGLETAAVFIDSRGNRNARK